MLEITNDNAQSLPKIVVIGVGGAGNNAVNGMIEDNMEGVTFVCVNTDKQQLSKCKAEKCVQIGEKLTKGLGCGADPEKGEKSAEESREEIAEVVRGADMVFVTCGMGGGTGTGASPVIAQIAKEMGILTVGIVTKPFNHEAGVRTRNAINGIEKLRHNVDTIIVIPNDKILQIVDKRALFSDALKKADEVLKQSVNAITNLINRTGTINLDFADIAKVMRDKGVAHIGVGYGDGEDKCMAAVENALSSPLLETSINGAKDIILNFCGEVYFIDANEAANKVREYVDADANVILGIIEDPDMKDKVTATIIATGMESEKDFSNGQKFENIFSKAGMMPQMIQPSKINVQKNAFPNGRPSFIGQKPYTGLQGNMTTSADNRAGMSNLGHNEEIKNASFGNTGKTGIAADKPADAAKISQPVTPKTNIRQNFTTPSNAPTASDKKGINIPEFLKKQK